VASGGPAAQAGLRPGDVVISIDGEPATSNVQLQELTLTKKPGVTVTLGYSRDGKPAAATGTLWPCQPQLAPPFFFYVAPHSVAPG